MIIPTISVMVNDRQLGLRATRVWAHFLAGYRVVVNHPSGKYVLDRHTEEGIFIG